MKILHTFNNSDGSIAYVEFIHNSRTKILSKETFKHRFGNDAINDFKRAAIAKDSLHVRLSPQEQKQRKGA